MAKSMGIGIVGCGVISDMHIKAIMEIPGVKLAAVTDVNENAAKSVAEKNNCDWYTDYQQMTHRADIDIIDICTPSGLRKDIAMYAAENKKHIIAEKPIEVTTERIDSILEACGRNKVFISGIFNKRYKEAYQKIKDIVTQGRLGKLVVADVSMKSYRPPEYYKKSGWRGTWALDGGGALMNQAIHYVDLLQWMVGPVDTVFAETDKLVHTYIETEDTAAALLRFKNGAMGIIQAATSTYPGFSARFSLHGENGGIIVENDKIVDYKFKEQCPEDKNLLDDDSNQANTSATTNIVTNYQPHKKQLTSIINSLRNGKEPDISGKEARKAVEIIEYIYKSASDKRLVSLPR